MRRNYVATVGVTEEPMPGERGGCRHVQSNCGSIRMKEYAAACMETGVELGVPTLDLWVALDGASANSKQYFVDGIHLSTM